MSSERFFIVGCQRTGTTLTRLILESHSHITCYDEDLSYAILRSAGFLPASPPGQTGFKIPRWTEQLRRPLLWGDNHMDLCKNMYRGESIIFMLRDAKDTIASMRKYTINALSWDKVYVPYIMTCQLEFVSNQYADALNFIHGCGDPHIGLCALYWRYKTEAYFEYLDYGLPVILVRYESLVTQPAKVLPTVCRLLGVEFQEELLAHPTHHHGLALDSFTVGGTDTTRPIHAESIGQWHQILMPEEAAIIDFMTHATTERFAAVAQSDEP